MDLITKARQALELAERFRDQELKQALLDVREGAQDLKEENLRLREELARLRRKQETQESLIYKGELYWRITDSESGAKEGPFCSRCWDVDGNLVRLNLRGGQVVSGKRSPEYWRCPQCNKRHQP